MKKLLIAITLSLALLISCRTIQPVENTVYVHDTIKVTKVEKETVHDSIFQDRYIYSKGDTVYVSKTTYKYKDRYIFRTDTFYQVRDSLVYQDVPVETTVYKVSGWGYVGWALLLLLIAAIIKRKWDKIKGIGG